MLICHHSQAATSENKDQKQKMQRLHKLRQLASNFLKTPTNTTFSNTFTAFHAKPTIQNPLFTSFSRHPFHTNLLGTSCNTLPMKARTFLFNPLLVQRSFLCLSSAQLRKCLLDCKVLFLKAQLPKRSFHFTPSFRSSGRRSWFHQLTTNDIVLGLIIANVAVFLLWRIADPSFMRKNFTISLDNVLHGRVHTMITSAFSHVDTEHIVSNMIGLYFFGMSIGNTFGPEYLLKLYLAGAIGGSMFFLVYHAFLALSSKKQDMWQKDQSRTAGLGASGAVNAIMLLEIFLNPKATIFLDFIIPVPAMLVGVFLIGKDMLRIIEGNSNISGSAHLGGAVVAALAWARIRRRLF